MRSLRAKLTLWYFSGITLTSFILLSGILLSAYIYFRHAEHAELNELEKQIRAALVGAAGPEAESSSIAALKNIDRNFGFIFDEDSMNFGYAVWRKDRSLLHEFKGSSDIDIELLSPNEKHKHFEVWSGYKDCMFYQQSTVGNLRLLICSQHHLGIVDHLLVAYLTMIPVILILSYFLGKFISRPVVKPLNAIARSARLLQEGDLSARIDDFKTGDEVEEVVSILNSAFQELHQSFDRIYQFSSDAAHELKTPITSIRGALDVTLRRDRSPDKYREVLRDVIADVDDMNKLIEQLLLLSKPGMASALSENRPVSLLDVLSAAKSSLSEYAGQRSCSIELSSESVAPVMGDRVLLTNLAVNLLNNAIKYSPPNSSVFIRLWSTKDKAIFVIEDNGPGIAPEHLPRIFDRFYRINESNNEEGYGLGLPIAKWIVDCHGGTIKVESNVGHGSIFRIEFPLP